MVDDRVITQYAIGGAVAAIFYIEPINTNDLDIFFAASDVGSGLTVLEPLYKYLSDLGYESQGETIDIESWPVQFLPVFNLLIEEALDQAIETKFEQTMTRVMSAEHLVAIMLQTGRLKDYARIQQFLEQGVVDLGKLGDVVSRHNLDQKWNAFEREYL
jgi:hypothetical protein